MEARGLYDLILNFEGATVTGGNPRKGRLDNGLHAADYAVVADVDPRVGEHLLDVLGNRGIAAYLQPTSDQHPITRLTALPGRPTDRLYVDRSELDTARAFLDVLAKDGGATLTQPEPAPAAPATRSSTEFDDAWASIVAGFDQTAERGGDNATPWPAIEDVSSPSPKPPAAPADFPRWRGGSDDSSLLFGLDSFGAHLADDDDDDVYHPPVPPPLPRFATVTIISIIGIIAGVAVIADPNLLPFDPSDALMIGGAAILAGAVGLIGRLRNGGNDDDPTNGAVL
jgi:hypothetical protein